MILIRPTFVELSHVDGILVWLRVSEITAVIEVKDGGSLVRCAVNPCVEYLVKDSPESVLDGMGLRK